MDNDLKVALKAYAVATGQPMSQIAEQALTLYLGRSILEARGEWPGRPTDLTPDTVAQLKAIAAIVLPSYVESHVLEWAPIEVNADGRARIAALQQRIKPER